MDLFLLKCGQTYLIQAKENFTLTLVGRPLWVEQKWKQDAYNMVGMYVDPDNPPSLQDWFEGSSAHQPLDVMQFDENAGRWLKVEDPSQTPIQAAKPYWVYCKGSSDYQGPVSADLNGARTINISSTLGEDSFTIDNKSPHAKSMRIELAPSDVPPAAGDGLFSKSIQPYAGSVPLSYFDLYGGGEDL